LRVSDEVFPRLISSAGVCNAKERDDRFVLAVQVKDLFLQRFSIGNIGIASTKMRMIGGSGDTARLKNLEKDVPRCFSAVFL